MEFKDIVGMTFVTVENIDDEQIVFTKADGTDYALFHSQDCCERVTVEDVEGDLHDLENTPILFAEESSSDTLPDGIPEPTSGRDDCEQWTFYRIRTIKGSVVIRWYGSSNGYYGVEVSFA